MGIKFGTSWTFAESLNAFSPRWALLWHFAFFIDINASKTLPFNFNFIPLAIATFIAIAITWSTRASAGFVDANWATQALFVNGTVLIDTNSFITFSVDIDFANSAMCTNDTPLSVLNAICGTFAEALLTNSSTKTLLVTHTTLMYPRFLEALSVDKNLKNIFTVFHNLAVKYCCKNLVKCKLYFAQKVLKELNIFNRL